MKTRLLILLLFFSCSVLFAQVTNTCIVPNAGFENGNTTGWILKSGGYGVNPPCPTGTCPRYGTTYSGGAVAGALNSPVTGATNRHTLMSTAGGNDPNAAAATPVPVVAPGGGTYSFRLGNAATGSGGAANLSQAEAARFTFAVTNQNAFFTYRYAFFVQDGSHQFQEQPSFEVVVLDQSDVLIPCGRYFVEAGNYPSCVNSSGFITGLNGYVYKPWTDVGLDLTGYIGQNVSIEFRTTDCLPVGGSSSTNCTNGVCTLTNASGSCTYASPATTCTPTGGGACAGAPGTHSAYAYIDAYCSPLDVKTPVFCAGAASVQICAPTGYTSYSWPAGQPGLAGTPTTQCVTINNPVAGTTYTVNMVSATGCPTSTKVTLKGFDLTLRDTTICNGAAPFPLTLTPSVAGNYNYSWTPSAGLSCTNCQSPTYTPGGSSTSYTVTMTDPVLGCSKTKSISITLKSTSSVAATGTTVCSGVSGTLTATGQSCSGAVTYSWAPSTFLSGTTGSSVTATNPTTTTTYTVTVTNGSGQTATATALLTVNPNPVVTVPPATICAGNSTTLTAGGATTYTWSPTTGLSSGTGATVTANPTVTTTYTVTGTNPTGCTGTTTVTVTVNPNPVVSVTGATICPGASAPLTASGATTYTWSPITGLSSGTGTTVTANPTVTTTYTVVGTTNGCTGSTTVVVTVTPPCGPTVATTGVTVCNGVCGSVTSTAANGTPPYTYLWNTGATTPNLTPAPCPTVTTTYTITVTDNSVPKGTASAIAVITVNPNPVVSVPAATICNGASTTLTASGATTYTWVPTTGLSSGTGTSVTANPNTTTTYTVTGSNPTGCTGTTTVTVTVNPIPVVTVPNASICPGGSTPLTASGATTYTWSPTTGLSSGTGTTVTANPSATTTYTVIGTSNGCTGSTTVIVNVGALVATVSPNKTICFGSSTQLTAGGGSIYNWTPATGLDNPSIFNPIASPTITTTYTVVVSDATCSDQAVVTITVDPAITLNVAPVNVTCFGACNGQTIVIPSGGNGSFTYAWSGGCTQAACNNVCAGTYTLTATDGVGCTATGTTTVTQPSALTVTNTSSNVSCFGVCDGTASVTAGGGTAPYAYAWSPSGGAAANATALCAGSYTCTVTDANSCTIKTSVTITQPTAIVVSTANKAICPNGSVTLNATSTGGSGAITFTWSPSGSLSSGTGSSVVANPTTTTVYTITGTDANGCTGGTSVTVTVNPVPVISIPAATICQGTSTTLNASGATTYSWSPTTGLSSGSGATVTANPFTTTTYIVVGTNSFGCTGSSTVTVTVNLAPVITTTGGNACPGLPITLTASGANTYSWAPPTYLNTTTGPTVISSPSSTTIYTITGVGANGCSATANATATVNPKPVAAFITSPDDANEFNPTIYFYDQSSGGPIVTWHWTLGDSANTPSSLQNPVFKYPPYAHTYPIKLVVVNQYGCIDSITGTVIIHGIFTFYIPNTFTPNNDGTNDGFMPKGVGIDESDYDLWIFDRWGNLIWHTSIWGDAWDGRANHGADVAQIDTYVWKVHVKEKETGNKHNYIGHVNIVK